MSSAFNHSIGQMLRRARKLRGLTQTQLASQLGISFQQVQKYESGVNTLSFHRVCALSALFGIPLVEWAQQSGAQPIKTVEINGSRQELTLLQCFHAIGSDERRTLLCQIARVMAEASRAEVA